MPKSPLDCSVIILNWNNAPDTLECLASVFASKGVSFNVYVADNGSTDDSLNILKQAYPDVTYIAYGANLGFAEGNNRAIQIALQDGAPFLFLLNNDAVIDPNTIGLLQHTAITRPSAAVLGPKIYYYDEPTTVWYGGMGAWDPVSASFSQNYDYCKASSTRKEVEKMGHICGCAFFIRSEIIHRIGLMDPRFFLHWEEIDWCWRIRKIGYDCLYVPQAKCWHKVSRSFVGGKNGPMWIYFFWRNRLLWMERNLPIKDRIHLIITALLPHMKDLLKMAFQNRGEDRAKARAALRGVVDYVLRKFGACPAYLLSRK